MYYFKRIFQAISSLLPFQSKPRIHRYLIFFNGDPVGVYWGEDLLGLKIENWMESFPGDPEPIMIAQFFEIYNYGGKSEL